MHKIILLVLNAILVTVKFFLVLEMFWRSCPQVSKFSFPPSTRTNKKCERQHNHEELKMHVRNLTLPHSHNALHLRLLGEGQRRGRGGKERDGTTFQGKIDISKTNFAKSPAARIRVRTLVQLGRGCEIDKETSRRACGTETTYQRRRDSVGYAVLDSATEDRDATLGLPSALFVFAHKRPWLGSAHFLHVFIYYFSPVGFSSPLTFPSKGFDSQFSDCLRTGSITSRCDVGFAPRCFRSGCRCSRSERKRGNIFSHSSDSESHFH